MTVRRRSVTLAAAGLVFAVGTAVGALIGGGSASATDSSPGAIPPGPVLPYDFHASAPTPTPTSTPTEVHVVVHHPAAVHPAATHPAPAHPAPAHPGPAQPHAGHGGPPSGHGPH